MLKKLKSILSGEESVKNRRRHVRSNVGLKLCVLMLRSFNPETGDRSYGRCFATETLDLSMGGLCIKHQNLLLKNELVEIRTKYSLINAQCKECKNVNSVDNIILTPIVGQVVWRTNTRCGIKILALDEIGKEVLHKLVWNQHLDEVRETRQAEEMRKIIEHRKKEAEKQAIIDDAKKNQQKPSGAPASAQQTATAPGQQKPGQQAPAPQGQQQTQPATKPGQQAAPRPPAQPGQPQRQPEQTPQKQRPQQKPPGDKPAAPTNRTPYVPPKKND